MKRRLNGSHLTLLTLVGCALALFAAACEGPSTPLAKNGSPLPVAWSTCAPLRLHVHVAGERAPQVLETLERAALAWRDALGPRIELVTRERILPVEDGLNSLSFAVPGAHCATATRTQTSGVCLTRELEGLTRLSDDGQGRLLEADVVLSRALLQDLERLFQVSLHEFGHVLGLAHWQGSTDVTPSTSVMSAPAPSRATRPGSADLRALRRSAPACSPPHR